MRGKKIFLSSFFLFILFFVVFAATGDFWTILTNGNLINGVGTIITNAANSNGVFDDILANVDPDDGEWKNDENWVAIIDNETDTSPTPNNIEYSVRLNSSVNYGTQASITIEYSLNEGTSWSASATGIVPTGTLTTYGNYSVSVSTWDEVNMFRVRITHIRSKGPGKTGTVQVDGYEVFVNSTITGPSVSLTSINETSVGENNVICVNHTVTQGSYPLDKTWVEVEYPNGTLVNITTSNSNSDCGGGGNVYEVSFNVGSVAGDLWINHSYSNDTQSNLVQESPFPNKSLTVTVETISVTLYNSPICFGGVEYNGTFVNASRGGNPGCSGAIEGFPLIIEIDSTVNTDIWFNASDDFRDGFGIKTFLIGNLSFNKSGLNPDTNMSLGWQRYKQNIASGVSNESVFWFLYLPSGLSGTQYTTTVNILVNTTS